MNHQQLEDNGDFPLMSPPPKYERSNSSNTIIFDSPSFRQQQLSQQDRQDLKHIAILPILNVIFTAVLVGILIFIYQSAEGKPLDYRMAGIPLPALVSLIMTLLKMGLAGGIGYALSEFKWIKLERGTQLSVLDVYDSITRGIGGMTSVFSGIRPDFILVPAILLQLGLIAMGPGSQQILTAYPTSYCEPMDVLGQFTNLEAITMASWGIEESKDIRSLKGTIADYLLQFALDGAGNSYAVPVGDYCPFTAVNCTMNPVAMVYNKVECKPGSFNETLIISELDRSVMTVREFYNYTDGSNYETWPDVPHFFYAGNMQYRTGFDIINYTARNSSGALPISNNTQQQEPPQGTMFAGEQSMVVLSNNGTATPGLGLDSKDVVVHECTFVPYLNRTSLVFIGREGRRKPVESTPIEMDYALLSDASHWNEDSSSDSNTGIPEKDRIMLNAYAMQVGELRALIDQDQGTFNDDVSSVWYSAYENRDRNTMENFLKHLAARMDMIMVFGRPERFGTVGGEACYNLPTQYHVDPAAYYTLSLCLLIPMFWWVLVWILALYRTGGVSRGNSQVLLLVAGFTSALRRRFKGMSHASSNTIFERAKQTDVKFGELIYTSSSTTDHQTTRRGHITFGTPDQISPLFQRNAQAAETANS